MAPIKSPNKSDRSEFWRQQLVEFSQYQGTQSQFCRERGFCPHLLHYWRKKFLGHRRGQVKELVPVSPFVPVMVERVSRSTPTASLPNAKWLAELIHHLQCGGEA